MAIIIRSITNNTPYTLTLKVPSLEENLSPVTVASSATLDLLSVVTEDDLIAMQLYLNGMVDRGSLTVAATIDTALFESGYTGGGGSSLIGVISNDSTQLTTSWNFLNFENASNSEIFFKTVGGSSVNGHVGWDTTNTYIDSSTGVQILTSEFSSPKTWLFDTSGVLTTPGDITLPSNSKLNLNSTGGYLQGNTTTGDIIINTIGTTTSLASIGQFIISANSNGDGSGTYVPELVLSLSGFPNLSSLATDGLVISSPLGASPDASAQLDLQSTTRGFLPPRMTTVQRDAISSPAEGLIVYNLDTHQAELWNGSAWVILG